MPPENIDQMARVARADTIPITTGERLLTKFEFRELLEKQAASIIQADLSMAGVQESLAPQLTSASLGSDSEPAENTPRKEGGTCQ